MKILSVEINNILSIESASLTFDDSGLLSVEGWNHDTQRANGAGKTAIFNGISFALFDKLPRKITASEILKRGSESGFASCKLISNQDIWEVTRRRPKGVDFIKNGVRMDITQKDFENSIRFSYDQFLLTMYTAQSTNGGTDRFLLKSDTDKKTFLLRLLDLEKFSACKKIADIKLKVLSADIDALITKVNNAKSKIDAYEESLVDEESLRDSEHILRTSLVPLVVECNKLASVPKPDLSKFYKLEEDINKKQNEIIQARTKREMLHENYRTLQQTLKSEGDTTCRECGSSIDTPERHERHVDSQKRITDRLSSIKSDIDGLDLVIANTKNVADVHRRFNEKKDRESATYQAARDRLSELRTFIKTKESELDNIAVKISSNIDLKSKIDKLTQSIVDIEASVITKTNELQVYEIIAGIYSPTGAQAYILDSVVDLFNETIDSYVDIVWPNASYSINSQKENSKGDMVAKFSETLMMGESEVSVGSLSGGEFKALSLCVDFAILDVLSKQFGLDLNPIILDEPFDGLDSAGKTIVINLLAKLSSSRQIVVVDHATEAKSLFPKVVRVEKRNDTSTVSVET